MLSNLRVFVRSIAAGLFCLGLVVGFVRMIKAQDGTSLEDKFREVDVDGDGKIVAGELPDQQLFLKLDADQDGHVTIEEARRAFRSGALTREMIQKTAGPPVPVPDSLETVSLKQSAKRLKPAEHGVGRYVADFEFTDLAGNRHKLSDFKDARAVVVAMTSTSCPLSRKLLPTLTELTKLFAAQNAQFILVNCVPTDKAADMKSVSEMLDAKAIYVHDQDELFARHMSALTTTDVFVIDSARTVVYHGAVDDQYGIGFARDAAGQHFLKDAVAATIAGLAPEIAATAAPGCTLDLEPPHHADETVTYHNRISRIVGQNCVECHRSGGVGPFSLDTYADVIAHAGMVRQVVDNRTMPPWFAARDSSTHSPWANDRSLTDVDRTTLLNWLVGQRPEGDPADAPLPRTDAGEWTFGEPDHVIQLSEPVEIKATGTMPYEFITVKSTLAEDRWVRGYEILPTDRSVVHHVIVNVHTGGRIFDSEEGVGGYWAAYVPGNSGQIYPRGFARKLPAGATVSFQIHYTPNGIATRDQLKLGIHFADEEPQFAVTTIPLADRNLNIPPNEPDHVESITRPVPNDIHVMAYMAHLHVRGKAFRFDLTRPDGTKEVLLDIPKYDFNWQLRYDYAEPKIIPRGSRVTVTAVYDNSDQNPANPDPSRTVHWGQQTFDEMMIGYVETFAPIGAESVKPARSLRVSGDSAFSVLDEDGNGQLSRAEATKAGERFPRLRDRAEMLGRLFDRMDSDGDSELSFEEFERLRDQLGRR
ncbi:MAG: EF-hand domain-containing protein [Planctomycetota bacterium]